MWTFLLRNSTLVFAGSQACERGLNTQLSMSDQGNVKGSVVFRSGG